MEGPNRVEWQESGTAKYTNQFSPDSPLVDTQQQQQQQHSNSKAATTKMTTTTMMMIVVLLSLFGAVQGPRRHGVVPPEAIHNHVDELLQKLDTIAGNVQPPLPVPVMGTAVVAAIVAGFAVLFSFVPARLAAAWGFWVARARFVVGLPADRQHKGSFVVRLCRLVVSVDDGLSMFKLDTWPRRALDAEAALKAAEAALKAAEEALEEAKKEVTAAEEKAAAAEEKADAAQKAAREMTAREEAAREEAASTYAFRFGMQATMKAK
ncbi:hypothetical protein BDV96DRAFT_653092 [Lophiotrema nucula]|uniref:Uncharacterized protein n=1 Tax=Lophiotrema nucula TaxID=690887 RepID=A0A6A5YM98_9PLEO|nr:hypothetical protein BDV96DRAFT_653092 [Lophiotrema nucula]